MTTIRVIRLCFLSLCTLFGYAVSQLQPDLVTHPYGLMAGFGLGALLIACDEMLRGFSLRAFSAATFGLVLGSIIAWLIDRSELFKFAGEATQWVIRLALFLCFGYIGIILAMRSNKEDFSLIIPYVRFTRQSHSENLVLLDTNVIIDGRIAALIEASFIEGTVVVPQFVLRELQFIADSADPVRRERGRRGLEMLNQLRANPRIEINIHEADFPEEKEVDAKLVRLARALNARLYTNDHNLQQIAQLQAVVCLNLNELAAALRQALAPGDVFSLRLIREGRDKGQALGYLSDGTMVVVNNAHQLIGQAAQVQVQTLHQTGAGVIVFAELKAAAAAA